MSGDALGLSLLQALCNQYPNLIIEGIVGPKLIDFGAKAIFPMETINVMGLIEPLRHLPRLWRTRKAIIQHFIQNPPDVFIGVDAPDFNLAVEKKLRAAGIKTVHFVSPTLWAWRAGRIHTIRQAVDLMLCIFPFEKKIYDAAGVASCFVGHPFADEIPLEINVEKAKQLLDFEANDTLIAILPGSRDKELHYLASDYLETAQWCFEKQKDLKFVIPVVSEDHKKIILKCYQDLQSKIKNKNTIFPLKIIIGDARLAMAACDVALVTSGTATLEVMLHKKPMVVGYRMNPVGYQIAKRLVKLPYIAMANIVAEEKLAPEFIQSEVIPEKMGAILLKLLQSTVERQNIIQRYTICIKP